MNHNRNKARFKMPTTLDRALQSKSAFWGMFKHFSCVSWLAVHLECVLIVLIRFAYLPAFAGTIGVVSAWAIWGGDMFPQQPPAKSSSKVVEPKGGEQRSLRSVSHIILIAALHRPAKVDRGAAWDVGEAAQYSNNRQRDKRGIACYGGVEDEWT